MESKLIKVIRWINRILSTSLVAIFVVFLIGEGIGGESAGLTKYEGYMIFFVPVMLSVGIILAWFKEMIGGIIMIGSVIGFNIVGMLSEGNYALELDFGVAMLFGVVFVFLAIFSHRKVER